MRIAWFVMIFIGILLFTVVTNEIFNYKKLLTLNELVLARVTDMELYLNQISDIIKSRALPQEMIDECKINMAEFMKNSTYFHFEQNHFYQDLTPRL